MLTSIFYKLLNKELVDILEKNPEDEQLNNHKDINQNKGYAFLVWLLKFYGQKPSYKQYITDGKDDYSCDIIFSNIDAGNQKWFYVVQSKWLNIEINKEGKLIRKKKPIQKFPQIEKEEFNATIKDFDTVLDGARTAGNNERFNKKYAELIEHLENNGKAKFIFFTAAQYNSEIQETINSFNRQHAPNVSLELIDINKIKRDYIEFKYKEIVSNNPLEYNYDPEDSEITLELARFKKGSSEEKGYLERRDMLQFEGRTNAYIFLLKPKTIYELFKKYKYSLFFKNIRNPLHHSEYNKQIIETLKHRPDTFWYFNNGITAITKLIPDMGNHAEKLTVKGLQVINGAQTVYSIYKAYEDATLDQREVMDTDARVSFRLIRSSDEQFNLEITRFTNQQNKIEDRDCVANLDTRRRLQLESFDTNYWYEKRRGEFRNREELKAQGIQVIPNNELITAYMAFHLQRPFDAMNTDKFFLRRKDDVEGLYDEVFNEHTRFDDMLAAAKMSAIERLFLAKIMEQMLDTKTHLIPIGLASCKLIIIKYLSKKGKSQNVNEFIHTLFENKEKVYILENILVYSMLIYSRLWNNKVDQEITFPYMNTQTAMQHYTQIEYEKFKEKIEEIDINVDFIENPDRTASGLFDFLNPSTD